MAYAQITGWGMHVPDKVVTNDAFVDMGLDTSNEWIASRTGIHQRHIVGRDEPVSDLAVRAAQQALRIANAHPRDLDLVILATCTPDQVMPSTASTVQNRLGAINAGAFDLNAACSGFVYALATAAGQIESGRARTVMVIGADELSIHLNWKDRSTCVLFGDGAGAVLLRAADEPGILASTMGSDGSGAGLLQIANGKSKGSSNGHHSANGAGYLTMNGPQVFRFATQMLGKAARKVLDDSKLTPEQIDLFIPHQANHRIIESATKRLGLPEEKVFSNVAIYGNTSAASIPIALCEAISSDRVHVGDNILLSSFGSGLSWAALALRWGVPIPQSVPRWTPIRLQLETRIARVRAALKKQERAVRAAVDERMRGDGEKR
jgi:3-oxoacyl-[acyl-carrier-protein] synthase-3